MKLSKEEKALIKAYVNLQATKIEIKESDASWLKYLCISIIDNKNSEYRYLVEVEKFISKHINKIINK